MMENNRGVQLFWLGIFTFLTALFWLSLDGYHALVEQKAKLPPIAPVKPLNPKVAERVLQQLAEKKFYPLEKIQESLLVTPTPTATPASSATSSGTKQL